MGPITILLHSNLLLATVEDRMLDWQASGLTCCIAWSFIYSFAIAFFFSVAELPVEKLVFW